MSVFLLLLGAVTTVSGLALVVSGVTIHDGTFDEAVIPGTIAAVGGLLLVGMGLAVRELQRIERALAVRPVPRPARPSEAAAYAPGEAPNTPVRLPFPPKLKASANPLPAPSGANTAPLPAEVATLESLRAKFPSLARVEIAPVVEAADVSLMSQGPARAFEGVGEGKDGIGISRAVNGAAHPRAVPRLGAKARLSSPPDRARGSALNAFWPATPPTDVQTAPAHVAALVPPPLPPAQVAAHVPPPPPPVAEVAPDAAPAADETAAPPISILKSGVVEGMAYTLYSDGSIEAQLPQGTLRFGSITALRDHIESAS